MDLERSYYEIYGDNDITRFRYTQLMEIMEQAKKTRPAAWKKLDAAGNDWYKSENMIGMMLYVDRFSDNLVEFEKRIDYLAELGVTYVHFMPLLKSRDGNNDGGYAVSDYLMVDDKFGTMKQLERVISLLKKKGIRTCIDFVLNHTAKEHVWAQKCLAGDPDYNDMYLSLIHI